MTFKQKLYCNNCRTLTNHIAIEEKGIEFKKVVPRVRTNDKQFENMEDIFYIAQCSGCDSIKYVSEFHYEQDGQWRSIYHIYPEANDRFFKLQNVSFKNLPDSLFFLVTEVHISYINKMYLLCSVGLRMIVEAICLDKGVQGRNLVEKINNLKENGYITKLQSEILHQIRLLGNKTAHEIVENEEELLLEGVNVINSILFNIYGLEKSIIYTKD